MDKSDGQLAQCPTASIRNVLDHFAHFGPHEEHVALLAHLGDFNRLRRKGDLLDEGVAAVFGLADMDAKLLGLCFHAERFAPSQAVHWLAGRGFAPIFFVSNSDRDRLRCLRRRS